VFCAHDADAAGSMIYQTLQDATKARGARKIEIVNIGLEPWDAIEDGLDVETVEAPKKRKSVADYILERDDLAPDDNSWEDWLQTHRIELNVMTTTALIAWLDARMEEHKAVKLVPPAKVLEDELAKHVAEKVRASVTERILREANVERQIADAIKAIKTPKAAALAKGIEQSFTASPQRNGAITSSRSWIRSRRFSKIRNRLGKLKSSGENENAASS
jgi:hypothetical protein